MNEIRFGDDRLRAVLLQRHERLELTLEAGGITWGPVNLLALEVHDKAVRRTERTETYHIELLEQTSGGAHVVVNHAGWGITVGLWLRIVSGELRVRLLPAEVSERKLAVYRLFAVDLMPALLEVGSGGQLLLPINTGVLCSPAGKPKLADRFLIYMEQPRWELCALLPICAAFRTDGGLVLIATEGDCDAECRVATDGQGRGHVGFACSFRRHWPDPVDAGPRELLVVPIPAKSDPLLFSAGRLRRHVMEDRGRETVRQRAAASPELAYLLNAYIMKLFHAIDDLGDTSGKGFKATMTFAEAGACLANLHAAGVGKIITRSVGWNTRGHDGLYPTRFPVEARLGGEKGFRDLITFGNGLGYHMNVHDNFMMNRPQSPDWDAECVTHDIYGEPLVHGVWAGGVECQSWPLAFPTSRLTGHLERMRDLGIRGAYYVDYMIQPLEVNYHPRHRGPRSDCARGMLKILAEARRLFGAVHVEFGPLPGVLGADCVENCGEAWHLKACHQDWPITGLLDRRVPLWQLALHDLVVLEQKHATWAGAMEAVLYGQHPRDEWSARPGVMPVLDARRIQAIKAIYDLCLVRFGRLQLEQIIDWRNPAEGVYATAFADGTTVTADFGNEELVVNGQHIPRPGALEGL